MTVYSSVTYRNPFLTHSCTKIEVNSTQFASFCLYDKILLKCYCIIFWETLRYNKTAIFDFIASSSYLRHLNNFRLRYPSYFNRSKICKWEYKRQSTCQEYN